MNNADITTGVIVLNFLFSTAAMVIAWWKSNRREIEGRIALMADDVRETRARLRAAEDRISALPAEKDMHQLALQLARVEGSLGAIKTSMEGQREILTRVETAVRRHEDHLLNEGKR